MHRRIAGSPIAAVRSCIWAQRVAEHRTLLRMQPWQLVSGGNASLSGGGFAVHALASSAWVSSFTLHS